MIKIGEIREELKSVSDDQLADFIHKYETDERTGVQSLVNQAESVWKNIKRKLTGVRI